MPEYLNNPQEITEEKKERFEQAVKDVVIEVLNYFKLWTGLEITNKELLYLQSIARQTLSLDSHWERGESHSPEVFSRFFEDYFGINTNELDAIGGTQENIGYYIKKLREERRKKDEGIV